MTEVGKQLILICGIPAMGKTTIGNFLENNYGFKHFDIEKLGIIPDLNTLPDKSVFTWGFVPIDENSVNIVKYLISIGFKMIWFDGDRALAKARFIKRGSGNVNEFIDQVERINNSKIVDELKPVIIDTITNLGIFKKEGEIIEEILHNWK